MYIYWTWLLFVGTSVLLYCYFQKKLRYFEDLGIPYVPGWPIFGNMASVFFGKSHINDIVKYIYNYHPGAKYVGFFDFGSRPVILLRDLDLIKSIAVTNFDKFTDHMAFVDEDTDPVFGGDLFNLPEDRWRKLKSALTPMFTPSKLKIMFVLMTECAQNLVNHIDALPVESRKLIDTKDLFAKSINDVIATCAFGISIDSLKNPENEIYLTAKQTLNLDGLQGLKLFVMRSLPSMAKFLKLQFVKDEAANFFRNIIDTVVKSRRSNGITRPDMIQIMMDTGDKDTNNSLFDLDIMTAQAFSFLLGGFFSTTVQMCLIAHELAINPDVQTKLQNEIDNVLEECHGNPTYESINRMQYLDAVFQESTRMHVQFGTVIDRVCKTNFEIPSALPGGRPITLSPGTNVLIPAVGVHHDSKYYDEPEKFDPDRYYQKEVNINLVFGIGPRRCIGIRFAVMEVKIILFYLLSKYTFKQTKKTSSPLVYDKKTLSLMAEGGFFLCIETRN